MRGRILQDLKLNPQERVVQQANNIKWRQQTKTLRGTQDMRATGWGFFVVSWHVFLFLFILWNVEIRSPFGLNVSGWPANFWKNVFDGVSNTIRPWKFHHDLVLRTCLSCADKVEAAADERDRLKLEAFEQREEMLRPIAKWRATLLRESNVWCDKHGKGMKGFTVFRGRGCLWLCYICVIQSLSIWSLCFQMRLFRRLVSWTSFHSFCRRGLVVVIYCHCQSLLYEKSSTLWTFGRMVCSKWRGLLMAEVKDRPAVTTQGRSARRDSFGKLWQTVETFAVAALK